MVKFHTNLLAFLSICSLIGLSYAVIWPCSSNDDCTATNSICSKEKDVCECTDFESVFSGDFSRCLKASLYGDQCEESVQCNLMPSGANCKSGVCDCIDDHTYVRGRCRPLNGLDESCNTDLDCFFGYDRQSVTCKSQICACANGYYRRNGNICRRKSMDIDDACVVDTDCDELGPNVQCISLKCQYKKNDENKINSNAKNPTAKLKTEEETSLASEATSQLSKSSKSSIDENVPQSPPSQPLQPSELSEPLQQFDSPSLTALSPSSSSSASSPSKAQVKATADAATSTTFLVNGDGNDLLEHETESENTNFDRTRRLREIAVQTSLDDFELKPLSSNVGGAQVRNVGTATPSNSTSSRRASYFRRGRIPIYRPYDEDKTFSTFSNTDDDAEENKYGSSCTENGKSCIGLAHSICSNSVCLCKQGYYHKNGKCFAELGEIAESDAECEHTYDTISKKCICQKNYFYERSLRACRKPIQFHLSCTSNSQCSPFGAAYCFPEIPRRCTCEEYAKYDAIKQMCLFKKGLGAKCNSNDGCPVSHSICDNRFCVCKQNFKQQNEICVAGVGAECNVDDDCAVENATCADTIATQSDEDYIADDEDKDRTCQCRKGYVHFKDECLKEASDIEDECIETEQCKPLLGTCIDKKCSCTPEQHFKFGRCEDKKDIGEACSREGECFIEKSPENVECRNSICQCKIGYQADVEQHACIRVLPSKKNSSGRPSVLKIITFLLIGSAFLITSAAIKQAYY